MGVIDSHAHLTDARLWSQIDAVVARWERAGVDGVITVVTNPAEAEQAIQLCKRYPTRIHTAVGCHPHEAERVTDVVQDRMAELWRHHCVVAVGEIGLDYHYDFADRDVQRLVFARQLRAAAEHDLPVIIHCRNAFDDTIGQLVDHGFAKRSVVFHCFTGTAVEAARVAEHGWRISFTGIVTFGKSTWLHEIAASYPASELMVETDAPYLNPEPVRGRHPNEPANVIHVVRFLAELRGVTYEKLVEQTAENTRLFFRF